MLADVEIPIVMVGFGNADDIVKCLGAVAGQRRCPNFGVFICENGGPRAFEALVDTLAKKGGPCEGDVESIEPASDDFVRARKLRLGAGRTPVTIGEARDNFGFAGGAQALVRPTLAAPGSAP